MQVAAFDKAEVGGYNPLTGNYRLRFSSDAGNHTPGSVVFHPIPQIYNAPFLQLHRTFS